MPYKGISLLPDVDENQYKLITRESSLRGENHQIINTISHELRTPIAIINSNIQLLRDLGFPEDLSLKSECLDLCTESVENMMYFFENIQLINLAAKNQINASVSDMRVRQIAHHLFRKLAKQNLDYRRINIQWDTLLPEISSDVRFLRLILLCLCSNALKFSKDEIHVLIQTNQSHFIIEVRDFGIGIPEDETDLVFSPFYRARNVNRIPGSGIGLAVVSALTATLGGEIYLLSKVAEGTSIQVRISI